MNITDFTQWQVWLMWIGGLWLIHIVCRFIGWIFKWCNRIELDQLAIEKLWASVHALEDINKGKKK